MKLGLLTPTRKMKTSGHNFVNNSNFKMIESVNNNGAVVITHHCQVACYNGSRLWAQNCLVSDDCMNKNKRQW